MSANNEREQSFDRRRQIAELGKSNPIVRQCLAMAHYGDRPRLECMEAAVLALAESNQHLQKVATDTVIHGRSAFIVDPTGIQAVDAERLNNVTALRAMEDRIGTLHDLIRRIHDELHYGDIFQWNNGSQVWRDMEAEVSGESREDNGPAKQYMLIDMDNGTTAHDRLTRDEAMAKLEEGHYSLMPMKDDDNPEWHCSFCGRKGFALKGGSAHE